MNRTIKYLGISNLIIVGITIGIVYVFRIQIREYFTPTIEQIGDIRIVVKNDTSYVSAKLVVHNKLFIKIDIDTIDYKISFFEKTYLQSKNGLGIKLPSYGSDRFDFSIKIPLHTIIKDIKKERKRKDSTIYSVDISIQYSTIFGKAKIPVSRTAKIKIPHPPDLKIVDIKWSKVKLKSIKAIAKIKIINYSPVTLKIKNLSYNLKVLKQGNIKGNYKKTIIIQPKSTTFIELPLEINVKHIGKTLFQILINNDRYNYTLQLNASLESSGPVKETFELDLVKSGIMELKK
jgi:LEA14-like dessication related protein